MKIKAIKNFKARLGLQVKFESDTIRTPMMKDGVVIRTFDVFSGEIMEVINPIMIPSDCYEEVEVKKVSKK